MVIFFMVMNVRSIFAIRWIIFWKKVVKKLEM